MKLNSADILNLIRRSCPTWFEIKKTETDRFNGVLISQDTTSLESNTFSLEIFCIEQNLNVREAPQHAKLPSFCPERHINIDKTFCLGLSREIRVYDFDSASKWWDCLGNYMRNQVVASRTRSWPQQDSLSHGEAADFQIKAERLANKLGLADEYQKAMVVDSPSWLRALVDSVENRQRVFQSADIDLVLAKINRTNPRQGKKRRHLVKTVNKFLKLELSRRKAESEFWRSFEGADVVCCKTMPNCELIAVQKNSHQSDI